MAKNKPAVPAHPVTNAQVAEALHQVADLLEPQGANPFRISAYRIAAETIRQLTEPVVELFDRDGHEGLLRLDGIGRSLAHSIEQIVKTGHLPLLDRLQGDFNAERAFATVPDIGAGLAHRIHEHLHIETLAELQAAATNGSLATVPGMGPKRIRAVTESLAGRLRTNPPARPVGQPANQQQVPVCELLEVDEEYRRKAAANQLPRIAPRRFNPTAAAWLPILHTERGKRHYTIMFSNTAHAHEMGTTHDWVVIYRDDDVDEGRWTVITAQFGQLRGRRIVRGREKECAEHYRQVSDEM